MVMSEPAMPRYLSLLWGYDDPAPRRGPRPTLTIADIGHTGVAVADEKGADALSMKAIADKLGMTTMSLYRYVDTKDDVIDIVFDTAIGPADPAILDGEGWRTRAENWARSIGTALLRHPWLAGLALTRPPLGPAAVSWLETGVRCFDDTPLSGRQRMSSLLLIDGFVRQHVRQTVQMQLTQIPDDRPGYDSALSALTTPEAHPGITAALTGPHHEDDDYYETELTFGLTIILDGLATLIDR